MNKELREKIIASTVMLVVGALVFLVLSKFVAEQSNKTEVEVKPQETPSLYPDYDVIKGKNASKNLTRLNLTIDCPENGCINDRPASIDFDGIIKTYRVKGKLSRAYLYIEALVDYTRPLTSWDGIYFTINYWGGHLVVDNNVLPVPPNEISRYLYNLQSISFYETLEHKLNKTFIYANTSLFSLFTDGNVLTTRVAVSSDRPGRVLREVSIYYECFESSDCSIDPVKP